MGTPFGDGEHGRGEINANDVGARTCQGEGDITDSATNVEGALAGLGGGEFDQPTLPEPMQAEALEIVQEIVAVRYFGEQRFDLNGTTFAGFVILIRTAHEWQGQISAEEA